MMKKLTHLKIKLLNIKVKGPRRIWFWGRFSYDAFRFTKNDGSNVPTIRFWSRRVRDREFRGNDKDWAFVYSDNTIRCT